MVTVRDDSDPRSALGRLWRFFHGPVRSYKSWCRIDVEHSGGAGKHHVEPSTLALPKHARLQPVRAQRRALHRRQ